MVAGVPRPLSPMPIVIAGTAAAAILWSSDMLDDLVGGAAVITVCHLLVWLGLRGHPKATPGIGARIALALGGGIPATSVVLTLIPWIVADNDGLDGLGVVIGMLIFGMPAALGVFAALIYVQTGRGRTAALGRVVAISGVAIATAWLSAIAWALTSDMPIDKRVGILAFPGIATWWLALLIAEHRATRDAA